MSRDSKPSIIPEKNVGFTVQASPLNQIKLELGAILIMGVALLLIIDFIVETKASQMGVLAMFGLTAMGWIIIRVKKTLNNLNGDSGEAAEKTTES